jgi:DNA helicase II / ATP-dependent DNA helicase PcrA
VGETSDLHLIDFFYELLAHPPFSSFQKNEIKAKNLAIFSKLLTTFQNYYHIDVITERNNLWIPNMLFVSFLKFLLDSGIDDYQDSSNPVPKGYVQIMTVHQSKGLEFPVVVVGSLDEKRYPIKSIDRDLSPFYNRAEFEPEDHRI